MIRKRGDKMGDTTTTVDAVTSVFTDIWQTITDNLTNIVIAIIMIALFWIIAKLILNQLSKYTSKAIIKAKKNKDLEKGKQVITAMTLLNSIGRYAIYFILIALILYQVGFGNVISNLIVTAGFGSLAISFGAQSIVKDVVTGFFMMFEKQFSVGDFVKIGEFEGTVTAIAMRVTYLRNFLGQKIIIPNGSIANVVNYGNEYSMATVTIPTPYEANTKEVIAIIQDEIDKYAEERKDIFVDKPLATGVISLNSSSVDIYVIGKVKALNQWQVERDFRLIIKNRFDLEGIRIPYQQVVIHKED